MTQIYAHFYKFRPGGLEPPSTSATRRPKFTKIENAWNYLIICSNAELGEEFPKSEPRLCLDPYNEINQGLMDV